MMWLPTLLVLTVCGLKDVSGDYVEAPFRVAAWNIQRLGPTKMGKPEVVAIIVEVMRRYDIVVALEVVDASGVVPIDLLNALNEGLTDTYNLTISGRLGRTSYKEQYAFYWKPSRVNVVSTFQYNDDARDAFQFEPFVVVFEGKFDDRLSKFAIFPIHTKPSDAVAEIDALVDVYDSFKQNTGIKDVIILGDFNSGCTYVGSNDYFNIRLWNDPRFSWLVSDHADTTVKGTTCPYDRIVLAGANMSEVTYKNTAKPYYFDEEIGLTDDELIEDVSDHYPIEVSIRGKVSESTASAVTSSNGVSVTVSVTPDAIAALTSSQGSPQEDCSTSQDLVMVTWTVNSASLALESLEAYSESNPEVLSKEAVAVVQYKANHGGLKDSSLQGEEVLPDSYTITLLCQKSQASCTVSLTTPTSIN